MSEGRERRSRPGSASRHRRRSSGSERAARYLRIKTIGKGSYGTVDLVKRRDNNKLYVMKRVKYTVSNDAEHKGALREVQFLKMLKHPNIVDFGEAFLTSTRSHLCIVMGYCEGGDLIHRIRAAREERRYIAEDDIMEWFVQMCMALAYLHDRKILHRDIKPHNVFLTNHGRVVKVGDFGVTRILDHTNSMAKTTIGTPYYVSPEICSNKPYNAKSDVWALGVVLYELCALGVPFDASNFTKLRVKILKTDPPPLRGPYSEDLRQLVGDMLIKNPRERPTIRSLLKRRVCQHHLRLLMKRHSRTSSKSKSKSSAPRAPSHTDEEADAARAAERQRRLEAELAEKQRRLAEAEEAAKTTPRGPVHLDLGAAAAGDAKLSRHERRDFIGAAVGAAAGASKEESVAVQRLQKEVDVIKDELAHTSVAVHKVAVQDDRADEEDAMQKNAKTIVELAEAGGKGDEDDDDDDDARYEAKGHRSDDEADETDARTASLGQELVHQLSRGNLNNMDMEEVKRNAELRTPGKRAASLRRGGPVRAVRGAMSRPDELREIGAAGADLARSATSDPDSPLPIPRRRLGRYDTSEERPSSRSGSRHRSGSRSGSRDGSSSSRFPPARDASDSRRRRHREEEDEDAFTSPRASARSGSTYRSRGGTASRGSRGTRDSRESRAPEGSRGSTASAMARASSRAALMANPMGYDDETMAQHHLRLNEPRQEQALLLERLPLPRPVSGSGHRPITAGSDFSEGLDSRLLTSVRSVESDLPGVTPRSRPGSASGTLRSARRRRSSHGVSLKPLHG